MHEPRLSSPRRVSNPAIDADLAARIDKLRHSVEGVIRGKSEIVTQALVALFSGGHLLIEDVPGVGKTMLAQALARSLAGSFRRIQFTSDLLPSDIIGVSVFDPTNSQSEFKPGPLFANVVLADEINRSTPKTQSALLEAMNESQASVDNASHPLPKPFVVIATQNPIEHHGMYPLPESQLDRFLMRVRMGYPDEEHEKDPRRPPIPLRWERYGSSTTLKSTISKSRRSRTTFANWSRKWSRPADRSGRRPQPSRAFSSPSTVTRSRRQLACGPIRWRTFCLKRAEAIASSSPPRW